jgi:hypothetical protein
LTGRDACYDYDAHQENTTYTQDGLLSATLINNLTRVQRAYDAAGRTTVYQEWDVNSNGTGTTARTNLTRVWDADGRETSEYETIGKRGLAFTLSCQWPQR